MVRIIDEKTGKLLDASAIFNEYGLEDVITMVYYDGIEQEEEQDFTIAILMDAFKDYIESMSYGELHDVQFECSSILGFIEFDLYQSNAGCTSKQIFFREVCYQIINEISKKFRKYNNEFKKSKKWRL